MYVPPPIFLFSYLLRCVLFFKESFKLVLIESIAEGTWLEFDHDSSPTENSFTVDSSDLRRSLSLSRTWSGANVPVSVLP